MPSPTNKKTTPQPETFELSTTILASENNTATVTEPAVDDQLVSKLMKSTAKPKVVVAKEPEMYIFSLVGAYPTGFPRYESMCNEMPIYDEKEERNRTIRLVRGVSSIFVDEQLNMTPQYLQRNKVDIIFNNGFLRVPRTNRTLLNFLMNSDEYDKKKVRMKSRKPRFTLINTAERETQELEKEQTRFNAIQYAMNCKEEDMIPHAVYLKIGMINQYGEPKSPAKIRVEYANFAGARPDVFMKSANSPLMKSAFFILKAIEGNIISLTKRQGYAVWTDSEVMITEIPFAVSAVDYLAEYALGNEQAQQDFYKQLKSVL